MLHFRGENCKINFKIERVLIDCKKYLSRATDEDGTVFLQEGTSEWK